MNSAVATGKGVYDLAKDYKGTYNSAKDFAGKLTSKDDKVRDYAAGQAAAHTMSAVLGGMAGKALGSRLPKPKTDLPGGGKAIATNRPDFIVSPNGTAFPVPKGASGPTPITNKANKITGSAYTGGKGGANGQVSTMRIMDSTSAKGNSPGYPNGYIKYTNNAKQGVDPYTGKTLPNTKNHFGTN
ncbi:polymorphic toxin type 10 domain-containing protein (plasmid) [Leptospira noguchii]|uniref:Polymorphic toxin type 10 domain-containing protein n=1 Tax=Leptospira noguchii TaxID=28182 RepID=A0AAE9GLV4_9LEPT|nr:polymorphic toxin type 10 domain-containing protein [Leptospira noguchii]